MTANDGHDSWRASESRALSDLVQKRLRALQNPEDCSKAKKLVCKLNKGCGYGCQIHHAVYCFIVAYGTERTLILKSKGWRYNKGGFEEIFMPLSETCNDPKASRNHKNLFNTLQILTAKHCYSKGFLALPWEQGYLDNFNDTPQHLRVSSRFTFTVVKDKPKIALS